MADEKFDVEAYLEAPIEKPVEEVPKKEEGEKRRHRSRSRSRDRDRKRRRSRSRERDRDYHDRRDRDRYSRRDDRDRDSRDRRRDDRYDRSDRDRNDRRRDDRYDRDRYNDRRREPRGPRYAADSEPPRDNITTEARQRQKEEEDRRRDLRTVFIARISTKASEAEITDFFEEFCGKVREVRLIADRNTLKSKGSGYLEFEDDSSVPKALAMTGKKFKGATTLVQLSQAERNHAATLPPPEEMQNLLGPMRVWVGNLHPSLTEMDLKQVFEPFGNIGSVQIPKEANGVMKGYAFIQFDNAENAARSVEHVNGLDLLGQTIKVGYANDPQGIARATALAGGVPTSVGMMGVGGLAVTSGNLQSRDLDRLEEGSGYNLNRAQKIELMTKLTRDADALAPPPAVMPMVPDPTFGQDPTSFVLLKNMFDPNSETEPNWHIELREDVTEECGKHGRVVACVVDVHNPAGHIYLKFENPGAALGSKSEMQGRWFAGRQIQTEFVSEQVFMERFAALAPVNQLR